jgi:pimeloyl-ACP methyl ester carboxylesterase
MSAHSQTPPDMDGVRHEWIDAGGLRTHVALAGPEDGPPLLLVHGWPQHWWAWHKVIPALAERYRVICPDLRGHGWTDAPPGGYDKEQLATDLLALLDAMGIDKVTWVGHDWGAHAGLLAALRAPERFERLLMLCVPPIFSPDRSLRSLLLILSYQGPISTPLLGRFIVRQGFAGRILRIARGKGEWSDEEVRIFDDVFRSKPHTTVGMYRTFLTRELLPIARGRYRSERLQVPTQVIVGDSDLITKRLPAGPYEGQPNIVVKRVPDVGHFLPEEEPDAVIAALS